MSRYTRDVAQLSDLETFDPNAFVGDKACPQELCDFVLALALAYNDFRNIVVGVAMLDDVRPKDMAHPTKELGQFAGIQLHLIRLSAGVLRSLMELIEKNQAVMMHAKFVGLVKNLPAPAREAWLEVVGVAREKPSSNPLAMLLVRVRNKVTFHYDPVELSRGYSDAFLSSTMDPYISRGASMAAARFYFADAAAELYVRSITDTATTDVRRRDWQLLSNGKPTSRLERLGDHRRHFIFPDGPPPADATR